ncbi:hypothetical protein [Paenibacillus sp. OV219]|uniref:hypothetical protein n=1 Tax=Paenibacillus sp. OV219 TaxID=1884377 RepID=UPI0008B69634|nr:hypothetical protein [Paenibacillus sp. OV219]SEM81801.1 hypothetical protein SAMN05518847_101881 [Paenibacillus sp. OV219]
MASDITKIQLGPCRVTFDAGLGGTPVVFETTQGGVLLNYDETSREIKVDQFGDTPVGEIIIGRNASIEVPFAEKDLDKLSKIIPGSKLTTNGTAPTKKRVDIDASKVINLLSIAKMVKLEPLAADATPNDAIVLYKAAPRTNLKYKFSYDGELITNVTFKAYPDTATGYLVAFGDITA